tara:strand:+ start:411 stop:692 length:282 start_codon:yes stop_codon:yes gene_type:complete
MITTFLLIKYIPKFFYPLTKNNNTKPIIIEINPIIRRLLSLNPDILVTKLLKPFGLINGIIPSRIRYKEIAVKISCHMMSINYKKLKKYSLEF